MEAKKLISAILIAGLILFGFNGNVISVADTDEPNNDLVSGIGNSLETATITITIYAVDDE